MLTDVKAGRIRRIKIFCIENNAGVCRQSPSFRKSMGVRRCGNFTAFSKKYAFLGIV